MHFYKALGPFVLFVTTFITAVLATPINVPIRRDTAGVISDLSVLNQDIVSVNSTIGKLSPADQQDIPYILSQLATVINDTTQTADDMSAFGPFDENNSEKLMTGQIIPVYAGLIDTVNSLVQQHLVFDSASSITPGLPVKVQASLQALSEAFQKFRNAIEDNFIPADTVAQQESLAQNLQSKLNAAIALFSS